MTRLYDYYTAGKRIILIALDKSYDIPELILYALGNMGVDNLITNPGYTYAFGVKTEHKSVYILGRK